MKPPAHAQDCVFMPMQDSDLDWVVAHEQQLHFNPWTRGNFTDALASGYSAWVLRLGDAACGYAVVLRVLDEAHLLNLSVLKAAQGRGLGRALLEHLCVQAGEQGVKQFFLEVRPSNHSALALYQRSGFETIGRRKGYYPAPGGREDAIVMRRAL